MDNTKIFINTGCVDEDELQAETDFVTDQYTTFYTREVQRRRLTVLPDPNDPLSIIPTTSRGTAIEEMKNRGNWTEKPSGPFDLVGDERLILPVDLTRFAEVQKSPLDRHRMAVHLLQLLGCPMDLKALDRFYPSTPDGIENRKNMILIGHPDRPIIVRALGTPAAHGLNIEQMWVIYSHLYKDAAKRQLEPVEEIKPEPANEPPKPKQADLAKLEPQDRSASRPALRFQVVERPAEPVEVDLEGEPVQKQATETTDPPKPAAKPEWDPTSIAHYPDLTRRDLVPHMRYINKKTGERVVVDLLPGIEVHYSNSEDRGGAKRVHRDDFLEEFVKDF